MKTPNPEPARRDWWAKGIALLALIVASGSLIMLWLHYSVKQTETLVVKILEVWPTASNESYRVMLSLNENPKAPAVLQVPWYLTVSNTGDRTLSLLEYYVDSTRNILGTSVEWTAYGCPLTELNGRPVSFPITLAPGESKAFRLRVEFFVAPAAFNILKDYIPIDRKVFPTAIKDLLNREGIDLFGNKLLSEPSTMEGHLSEEYHAKLDEYVKNRVDQINVVSFTSSKGNVFCDEKGWLNGWVGGKRD